MKENYKAWDICYEDFYQQKTLHDQLTFLIRFAVLAPSGHNTQPWDFIVEQDCILLLPVASRALPKSDPLDRQLYISLGCALENLLVAADYYNFDTEVQYAPLEQENVAAKIIFKKRAHPEVMEDHLIFAIPKRRTNRNKYQARIPEGKFADWLKNVRHDDLQIDIIEEKTQKDAVADISLHAMVDTMDNVNFRDELSHYLKNNFTKSKVGMPGFAHGIPAPVSLIAPRLIRHVNMNRLSLKQDEELLKKFTPAFCLISSKADDKKNWLEAGQYFERIALEAEKNGLKIAPLAAAMENDVFNQKLKKLLGLRYRPQVFFRIGYCDKNAAFSPRLQQTDVVHNF